MKIWYSGVKRNGDCLSFTLKVDALDCEKYISLLQRINKCAPDVHLRCICAFWFRYFFYVTCLKWKHIGYFLGLISFFVIVIGQYFDPYSRGNVN